MPARNGAKLFEGGFHPRHYAQVANGRAARAARAALQSRKLLRAARLARLGRAAALAGSALVAPEAVALAGTAALTYGAYRGAKYLHNKNYKPQTIPRVIPKQGIEFERPTLPPVNKPDTSIPKEPEMAPIRNGGQGGRKRMYIPKMGPVTQITKAPVAIGNTVRGRTTIEKATKMGKQCYGRDFMFTPIAPGAVSNWTLIGASPLSPTAFADSTLRQYAQIYNKFRFLEFTVHFITSSPTSTNGDVMFYYGKNRESPFLNQTSVNLLPFVMSDPNAIIGPQWQNLSATFDVDTNWKSLDYGMEDSPAAYAAGELFLLCKTSNTESPGYVMFDYVIEFGEKSIQPRLLSLPITRQIYSQLGVGVPSGATVINTPYLLRAVGNNISGTTSVNPVGIADGDIYKVIVDVTNSTLGTNATSVTNSLFGHEVAGSTIPAIMSDGFTCYAVYNAATTGFYLYASANAAYAGSPNRIYWASFTGPITIVLQIWISYVGSINYNLNNISNF